MTLIVAVTTPTDALIAVDRRGVRGQGENRETFDGVGKLTDLGRDGFLAASGDLPVAQRAAQRIGALPTRSLDSIAGVLEETHAQLATELPLGVTTLVRVRPDPDGTFRLETAETDGERNCMGPRGHMLTWPHLPDNVRESLHLDFTLGLAHADVNETHRRIGRLVLGAMDWTDAVGGQLDLGHLYRDASGGVVCARAEARAEDLAGVAS